MGDKKRTRVEPPKGVSRRQFLTTAGIGAVGLAAARGASSAPVAAAVPVVAAGERVPAALRINGREHRLMVEPRWSLLHVLREELGLTGAKPGCQRGECGSCTVLIDDRTRYACLTLALEAEGAEITTLEGLLDGEELGEVQRAFAEHDAFQCGYCTPGQVMAVEGLLRARPDPNLEEIRVGVSGNLCQRPRCWYYRGDFHCAKKGGDLCYAVEGENRYHAIFGGGPCHIVHPSDTAPMLVALGAAVRIAGPGGEREIPAAELFVLPEQNLRHETVLKPDEMITEVSLPRPAAGLRSSYRKVRERGSWDFALTSAALALRLSGRRVEEARVVLGGVAPIPWRSPAAEAALTGQTLDAASARAAAEAAAAGAEPLEQNGYKALLVKGVVEESLLAL